MSGNILVVGEVKEGILRNVSFEAIAAAKKMDANANIVAVLLGEGNLEEQAIKMIYYGADRTIVITHDKLKDYTSEGYSQALFEVINSEEPKGIVMGHTSIGKDLAPKIAARLDAGLVSDIVNIESAKDEIIYTRPIYSGKAFEKKVIVEGLNFITVRPNNITPLNKDESRTVNIDTKDVNIKDVRTIIKGIVRKSTDGVDMSGANVVIAGGRGVKSADGFKPLYDLAEVLGGAVGASRGACDADYCDYSLQIGQTGKVITPDLYIAVGISGAIQHLAGMSNSKVIVAINKDADANIFKVADYGIVGDMFEVIPTLIGELKQEKVNA